MAVRGRNPPPTDPKAKRPPARAGAWETADLRIGLEDNREHARDTRPQDLTQEKQEVQESQEIQEPHGVLSSGREEGALVRALVSLAPLVSTKRRENSLQEFLRRAAKRSTKDLLQHEGSTRPEDYRGPSWMFARCLKGRKEFAGLDAEEATARVDAELAEMFPGCPIPWLELGLQDFDSRNQGSDPRTDFMTAWDAVRKPFRPGSFIQEAVPLARETPLDLGPRFSHPADALFRQLVALCYALAQKSEGEFFLSCRDAGEALGTSPATANQLLRRAEKAGFIKAPRAYSEKDRARRDAKTWLFDPASLKTED